MLFCTAASRNLFILFTLIFVSTVCAQNEEKDCAVRVHNHEKKFFNRLSPIRDTSIVGLSEVKGVTIQYLGAGGLLISRNGSTIAFDPFFSNSAIKYRKLFKPWKKSLQLQLDTAILAGVGQIKNLENTDAVFVTHAHYDHLLDVPYLYEHTLLKHPTIYGNASVNCLLKKLVPANSIINLQDSASQFSKSEMHWTTIGSNFRVLPILADHAPHYEFVKFFDGEVSNSPSKQEYYEGTSPAIWKEGRTLAYIVEVIDAKDTLRIHIQTSACTPTDGLPPQKYMDAAGKIDLSILCMASFNYVSDYPYQLIKYLKPEKIIVVHWENFFKKYEFKKKHYKIVPFTNGLCFIDAMEKLLYPNTVKSKCILPVPNSIIRVD